MIAGCRQPGQPARPAPGAGPQGRRSRVAAAPAGSRSRPGAGPAAAATGAAAGRAGPGPAGRAMLGDTGANAAGALVGIALLERSGLRGRLVVLVRARGADPGLREGVLHQGHRVDPRSCASSTPGAGRRDDGSTLRLRHRGGRRADRGHDPVRAPGRLRPHPGLHRGRCAPGGRRHLPDASTPCPTSLFEVAAGGVLAAIAVPLIAGQLGAGQRDRADRTRIRAADLGRSCPGAAGGRCSGCVRGTDLGVCSSTTRDPRAAEVRRHDMLRIFAVQVPLYGLGVVLAGLLQAHRRFLAAALAPLRPRSSCSWPPLVREHRRRARACRRSSVTRRSGCSAGAPPSASSCSPAPHRARPCAPAGAGARRCGAARDARADGTLAGAGVIALLAQQTAVVVTHVAAREPARRQRHVTVYTYIQAVYLLPYAVLAVPVATSAFPALAHAQRRRERTVHAPPWGAVAARRHPAHRPRPRRAHRGGPGCRCVLLAAGRPSRQRGHRAPSRSRRCRRRSRRTRPGLVGFGVAALLTRALYVRGRPMHAGCRGRWAGWLVAALLPLVVLAGRRRARRRRCAGWASRRRWA